MKNAWGTRVYLDLFAGSGHALLGEPRRRVLTSPLIALGVRDPFTKYVFCERDAIKLRALEARIKSLAPRSSVTCLELDTNNRASDIATHIPEHTKSNRVLSFCFIDPYNLEIDFETISALGANRALDFIIVLMIHMDAARNWTLYVKEDSDRIDRLLGSKDWRIRWREAQRDREKSTRFLAEEYSHAMSKIGYRATAIEEMIPVRSSDKNLLMYYLAFFSKHDKGYQFWEQVRKYSTDQMELDL